MTGYVLSADAEADLNAIWEFIARDDIAAADRWVVRLFEAFDELAREPGKGHARRDLAGHSVLFWAVGAYLLIYSRHEVSIEIVAITQGAREVPSFMPRGF